MSRGVGRFRSKLSKNERFSCHPCHQKGLGDNFILFVPDPTYIYSSERFKIVDFPFFPNMVTGAVKDLMFEIVDFLLLSQQR